jgi:hypothetical protein
MRDTLGRPKEGDEDMKIKTRIKAGPIGPVTDRGIW